MVYYPILIEEMAKRQITRNTDELFITAADLESAQDSVWETPHAAVWMPHMGGGNYRFLKIRLHGPFSGVYVDNAGGGERDGQF